MEKLGIEVLKKNLTVIATVSGSVDRALEDGKVDVMEGIGIAKDSLGFFSVIKNLKPAKEELQDLSATEKQELVSHFEKEFDLRNDTAEMVVETVVEIALGFIKLKEVNAA
ncbi:hypothetical protein ACRTDU_03970 [Sunxiuqinia elliptica]